MKQFYIADAFTTQAFGGNPAGVVILKEGEAFPADETMRKIAAELRYSETAFIRPMSAEEMEAALADTTRLGVRPEDMDGGFTIRYFTPESEVDLCGHATVASFHCLMDAGFCENGGTYFNRTLSGDLTVDIISDQVLMDMAEPRRIAEIRDRDELEELYGVMGIPYEETGLTPQIVSTGLADIMLPVPSRERLQEIDPDFLALSELSRRYEVTGVHAFAMGEEGGKETAFCRNFAPLYGINEEAATGTSNGALTYYLIRSGRAKGENFLFLQGEAMGRPSKIRTRVIRDSNGMRIRAGGSAVILVKGKIRI